MQGKQHVVYEPWCREQVMLMHEAEALSELMQFCKSKEILLIQDEIFVGFGRTGKLFAVDHLSEIPDIMCFSKGLTGGTLPLGITTVQKKYIMLFIQTIKQKHYFTDIHLRQAL
jgi:adenosylmethionine-8-amino-7-oxononanoate aminotransferase